VKVIKSIAMLSVMSAGLLAIQAVAGDAPTFQLTQRSIPERGAVNAVEFAVGSQKVSLILPKDWRVGQSSEGLILQAADYSATFTLKAVKSSEFLSRELKESMAPLAPKVVFGQDSAWSTGLGEATVIEAHMGEGDELTVHSRTFIINLNDQTLVVTLTASVNSFEKSQLIASSVISSLRAE